LGKCNRWSVREENELIEEFQKVGCSPFALPDLSKRFNRSSDGIWKKLVKLGLRIKPVTLHCAVCGGKFQTKNPRQVHCSRVCWSYHKTMRRRTSERFKIEREMRRLAAAELASRRMLEQSYFPYLPNQLGTFPPSIYLKVVLVNGQERIYGFVLLNYLINAKRRVSHGNTPNAR